MYVQCTNCDAFPHFGFFLPQKFDTGSCREGQNERDNYEDLDVGRMMILRRILEKWDEMILTHLAEDRELWRNLVNTVMNSQVP
jgi:hypothetical protein